MNFLKKKKKLKNETKRAAQKFVFDGDQEVFLNSNELVPVVLQDDRSQQVLHLGYMDILALDKSIERQIVFLFRRSKGRLEIFGEKNQLEYKIISIKLDRSRRSLLMSVLPVIDGDSHSVSMSSFVYPIETNHTEH